MQRDPQMQALVDGYQRVWDSREPGVMGELWHADGVLHHPALDQPITGDLVPHNNDFTKRAIPEFSWKLTRWASAGDTVFLEWECRGRFGGELLEWRGVDVIVLRDGKVADERVYMDTYPIRRLLDPALPDTALVEASSLVGERAL